MREIATVISKGLYLYVKPDTPPNMFFDSLMEGDQIELDGMPPSNGRRHGTVLKIKNGAYAEAREGKSCWFDLKDSKGNDRVRIEVLGKPAEKPSGATTPWHWIAATAVIIAVAILMFWLH